MTKNRECPIWDTPAYVYSGGDYSDVFSPRAGGSYRISGSAKAILGKSIYDDRLKVRLTSWLVGKRKSGEERPAISSEVLRELCTFPDISVTEKEERLLSFLGSESKCLGHEIEFKFHQGNEAFERLGDAHSVYLNCLGHSGCAEKEELIFLLKYLEMKEYVTFTEYYGGVDATCVLRIKGYARIEEIQKHYVQSKKAFVAMWFHGSMDIVWEEGIEPAILDTGYDPMRIDKEEHIEKIDDRIIASIRNSRFVVADFTHGDDGARGGVYYEAGFAHGLHIPVIFTCKNDSTKNLHFDTRQYNHIFWDEPSEFREKLTYRILATIGNGPNFSEN